MGKNIKLLTERLKEINKKNRITKKVTLVLSCIVAVITIYSLMTPAITDSTNTTYNLYLTDTYNTSVNQNYEWKTQIEGKYTTDYTLNLHFMDTNNNYIEGTDLTINVGPTSLLDDPYGFGVVPYKDDTLIDFRGLNLIERLKIYEYTATTGEIYQFDHAEVLVDGTWHRFTSNGRRWHIYCNGSSSLTDVSDYGWRGFYGENYTSYVVNENTEYKLVYKEIRYGTKDSVESLGVGSGITFKMFNYSGDNSNTGDNNINNNGVYDYFTFRGVPGKNNAAAKINGAIDADGYINSTRIKVLPTLDGTRNPVFDCRDVQGCNDFSLGYLFSDPTGTNVKGVEAYSVNNTLLQLDDEGNYYYDSNLNAVDFDTTHNKFMLRPYLERSYTMTTFENEATRYEFMPFNYWNSFKTEKTNETNSRKYNYENSDTESIDHWFGMTMEFGFYMSKEGILNGKQMEFNFSGDDDVWVFIDDVLVLDLGGTHGAVDGKINFATGEVTSYLNWDGDTGNVLDETYITTNLYQMYVDANRTDATDWDGNIYKDYTYHTLKFFYLERGASVSNCKIKFNMPVLPSGTLSVLKQFNGTDKYDETYEFTLYDTTGNTIIPVANAEYKVNDQIFYTNNEGKFTLKNDQTALFVLTNYHDYYVEETNSGQHAQSYSCTLNKSDCLVKNDQGEDVISKNRTGEFSINPDSIYQAVFTNEIKKFDLNIDKIVYLSDDEEQFEFKVMLKDENNLPVDIADDDNSEYTVDHDNGIVTFNLKNGESVTIEDIPIDTLVTLQELDHDGYQVIMKSGNVVLVNGDTYQNFNMDSDKNITVHNTPGVVLPETGGTGTIWYLLIGISLIAISIRFGYKFNIKEDEV